MADVEEVVPLELLTVTFGTNAAVVVKYDRGAFTLGLEKRLKDINKTGDPTAESCDIFCTLVKEWDLTKKGNPIPIEPVALLDVPLTIISGVLTAITEDINPNSKTSVETSAAG